QRRAGLLAGQASVLRRRPRELGRGAIGDPDHPTGHQHRKTAVDEVAQLGRASPRAVSTGEPADRDQAVAPRQRSPWYAPRRGSQREPLAARYVSARYLTRRM